MKKRKNPAVAVLAVLLAFFIALFVFLSIWWFGASHPDFYAVATRQGKIPGLEDGVSPQGLCLVPDSDEYDFAMSGYETNNTSCIYLLDRAGEHVKRVTFTYHGQKVQSHFGGIACTGEYFVIASEKDVMRVRVADVLAATGGGSAEICDIFQTGLAENAFCFAQDGLLYVGDFYHAGKYETDANHHFEFDGQTNRTLVYVYEIDEQAEYGIADTTPVKAISIQDDVQGFYIEGDTIYLSRSYGLPDSKLETHENVLQGEPRRKVNGTDIPLYVLNETTCKKTLVMPCMSEDICVLDGELYILFESMSVKYRYLVRTRLSHFYSIALTDLV